jgi:hypothetical protein
MFLSFVAKVQNISKPCPICRRRCNIIEKKIVLLSGGNSELK